MSESVKFRVVVLYVVASFWISMLETDGNIAETDVIEVGLENESVACSLLKRKIEEMRTPLKLKAKEEERRDQRSCRAPKEGR